MKKIFSARCYFPYDPANVKKAKELRKVMVPAEKKLWYEMLRKENFRNLKFLRQKPIDSYIADFYCAKLKLVIEIDGDSHAEKEEYDRTRTNLLNSYGITVLRYSNRDVLNNMEGVYQDLVSKIKSIPLRSSLKKEDTKKTPLT